MEDLENWRKGGREGGRERGREGGREGEKQLLQVCKATNRKSLNDEPLVPCVTVPVVSSVPRTVAAQSEVEPPFSAASSVF